MDQCAHTTGSVSSGNRPMNSSRTIDQHFQLFPKKRIFHLQRCLTHIPLCEDIMDHVGNVNCAWERTAFEEGVKTGIRLMMEVGGT